MRIFVAGAAGAIGRQLVPMLVEAGHQVTGTTRSSERAAWLTGIGAEPVLLDAYDAEAVRTAVADARPEVVIHQLTDLAGGFGPEDLARNARLRVVGTRNLVDATVAAGTRRLVAQSIAWLYVAGPSPRVESDPLLDPADAPDNLVLPGVLELERLTTQTTGFDGIVLRYGLLYGPGTTSNSPASPISVEVGAAARAALMAVDHGGPGFYNVVDDGGPVSNARARAELGWRP
jgi:nucleoside-diphosphate-sugar epimerase